MELRSCLTAVAEAIKMFRLLLNIWRFDGNVGNTWPKGFFVLWKVTLEYFLFYSRNKFCRLNKEFCRNFVARDVDSWTQYYLLIAERSMYTSRHLVSNFLSVVFPPGSVRFISFCTDSSINSWAKFHFDWPSDSINAKHGPLAKAILLFIWAKFWEVYKPNVLQWTNLYHSQPSIQFISTFFVVSTNNKTRKTSLSNSIGFELNFNPLLLYLHTHKFHAQPKVRVDWGSWEMFSQHLKVLFNAFYP